MRTLNWKLFKNNSAFTIVETVLALFIVSIMSILLFSSVHVISSYVKRNDSNLSQFIQAVNYMENELSFSIIKEISDSNMQILSNNNLYFIEFYKDMIRKRSTNGGHEPILIHVNYGHFKYDKQRNIITLTVYMKNGKKYEKNFYSITK